LIGDLEGQMPARNPSCLDALREALVDEPLTALQDTLRAALELGRNTSLTRLNINGTANHLEAELVDLCNGLATATGRTLTWVRAAGDDEDDAAAAEMGSGGFMGFTHRLFNLLSWGHRVEKRERIVSILYHPDAAPHSLRLRDGMASALQRQCDVSVPTASEMAVGLERIRQAECVLLLQTAGVLSELWVLLATFQAHVSGIPVVCVQVQGGGYDFGAVRSSLEGLDGALGEEMRAEMVCALGALTPPATLGELQSQLAAFIPNMISIVYEPDGTHNDLEATVRDIADKEKMLAKKHARTHLRRTDGRRPSALGSKSHSTTKPASVNVAAVEVAAMDAEHLRYNWTALSEVQRACNVEEDNEEVIAAAAAVDETDTLKI